MGTTYGALAGTGCSRQPGSTTGETLSTPTNNKTMLEDDRLLQSLLDGGKGKLSITTHPTRVESPSTGPEIKFSVGTKIDFCRHVECERKEDEQQSQGSTQPNNRGDRFHQSKSSLPINCVWLQPSESAPTPEGAVIPSSEQLRVNWSTVPVNTNSTLVCSDIHSRARHQRMQRKEEVGILNGGTLVGQLALWGLIDNKKAQHNPNFSPRRLLPRQQVLSSSLEGLDNSGTDNVGSLLNQEACDSHEGLQSPILATMGNLVTGAEKDKLRLQNRQWYHSLQDQQLLTSMWTTHTEITALPTAHKCQTNYHNEMCPTGIATTHLVGELLTKWSQLGCPTKT